MASEHLEDLIRRQMDDPLLRPSAAARRLGVHVETIWRWMRKGVIAFEHVGPYRKKRIRQSVVDALISRAPEA